MDEDTNLKRRRDRLHVAQTTSISLSPAPQVISSIENVEDDETLCKHV